MRVINQSRKKQPPAVRLHLNVQNDGEKSRRIVLEGRIGFSRLTAGILPKSQMFVSPTGDYFISGQPGATGLMQVAGVTCSLSVEPQAPTSPSANVKAMLERILAMTVLLWADVFSKEGAKGARRGNASSGAPSPAAVTRRSARPSELRPID